MAQQQKLNAKEWTWISNKIDYFVHAWRCWMMLVMYLEDDERIEGVVLIASCVHILMVD